MIIFVGDLRVKYLETAISDVFRAEVKPVFLYRNGARISTILEMLNGFADDETKKEKPVLVVIVGLMGDVLFKKTVPAGHASFGIREEVSNKKSEFPALEGLVTMRKNVEDELEAMWPGVRTLWVLPYPADLCHFVRSYASAPISARVECATNKVTLEFNNYMSSVDKRLQRGEMDWDVVPWIHFWKDVSVSGQKTGTPCEFREFMARLRKGERVPVLYPDSTIDGLYPRTRTSEGLIRAVVRKYRYTLAHLAQPAVVEKKPDASVLVNPHPQLNIDKLPQKLDQACQVDEGMERDPPVIRRTILPCIHIKAKVTAEEEGFLCEECDTFFRHEDLYLESFWTVYKPKPSKN